MSNRSFINRAAEERGQRLVVGRVVAQLTGIRLVGRFERVEHGVDRLVRIGSLALPLHRVEIVHIGLIGLFIVAEQTHRISRLFCLTRFLHANRYPLRSKTLLSCLTPVPSREPVSTSLENAMFLLDDFLHHKEMVFGGRRVPDYN